MKITLVIAMLLSSTSALRISHNQIGCVNAACCMEIDPPMFFDGTACVATMPGANDGCDNAVCCMEMVPPMFYDGTGCVATMF